MTLDQYALCPCGSGKKFKWCCQSVYGDIERAFQQEKEGQHDSAIRIMDEAIAKNPQNPELLGRKAQLLFLQNKAKEAEEALDRSHEVDINYAFGYFLRGEARRQEGDLPSSLALFRKATDCYDLEAKESLGRLFFLIADTEMRLNRPIASRAALQIAAHHCPDNEKYRTAVEATFGEQSQLPNVARREYSFMGPRGGKPFTVWGKAAEGKPSPRLSDLAPVFEGLIRNDQNDVPAWYNLGLSFAWMGDNYRAIWVLDRYVQLEQDENRAAAAWALAEVLRYAPGMEQLADHLEHSYLFEIKKAEPIAKLFEHFIRENRLMIVQQGKSEDGNSHIFAVVTEKTTLLSPEGGHASRLCGHLMVGGGLLRLTHVNLETLDHLRRDVQYLVGDAIGQAHLSTSCSGFGNILAEAMVFPVGPVPKEEIHRRLRESSEHFLEEIWVHRPLKSLNNVKPLDAVKDPVLRKKVRGVIQFMRDCAWGVRDVYDFSRLEKKLGLNSSAAPATNVGRPPEIGSANVGRPPEIGSMNPTELAALRPETLSEENLETAYKTAFRLDQDNLAVNFAKTLVAKPIVGDRTDRFPVFSFLVQKSMRDGKLDEALNWIDEGLKSDCEKNEGKRRNDYELRRGQIHVKRGEADTAYDIFDKLIHRVPSDLRVRISAVEGMLSLRQGNRALRFAEEGLLKAREQQDRDSERNFLELVAAAGKLGA